jgi:hypothetical protein
MKQKQTRIDKTCLTGVNPKHTHGIGIWGNPRVVFGVRVDEKLAKAFAKVAKAKFGSTCRAVEPYMVAVVSSFSNLTELGVNPSITVNIDKQIIERNLRSRRKLVRTTTQIDTVKEEKEPASVCGYLKCGAVPVAKGVFCGNGREFLLCAFHLKEVEANRREWRNIEVF